MENHLLAGDALMSEHLSLEAKLFEKSLGYLLHPSIPISRPDLKIADIGCGTGEFLVALRLQLPSATLHGYDKLSAVSVNSSQNIFFYGHDITRPFSDELQRTYDIVHCRYLGSDVPQELWKTAITNSVSLLKPGGHIQWVEPDHVVDAAIGHRKDKPAEYMQRLFDFTVRRAKDLNWDRETIFAHDLKGNVAELVPTVREEVVPCDYMYDDPEIRLIGIENSLRIFETALLNFLAKSGYDEDLGVQNRKDAEILLEKVRKEMLEGDGIYRYLWRVVIGKMALQDPFP